MTMRIQINTIDDRGIARSYERAVESTLEVERFERDDLNAIVSEFVFDASIDRFAILLIDDARESRRMIRMIHRSG